MSFGSLTRPWPSREEKWEAVVAATANANKNCKRTITIKAGRITVEIDQLKQSLRVVKNSFHLLRFSRKVEILTEPISASIDSVSDTGECYRQIILSLQIFSTQCIEL